MSKASVPIIHAVRDPALRATVRKRIPLFYRQGADSEIDRPAHVRAGSSLSWFSNQLALVQDDANFLVLIDPQTFEVEAITLPAGEAGLRQFDEQRGNKRFKLDLEACTTVPTANGNLFLAFGSGSTARREQILRVQELNPDRFTLSQAGTLYAQLRACAEFSGSELNLEGAFYQAGQIRLLNRGNGAPQGNLLPVNTTGDLSWDELAAYLQNPENQQPPSLHNICQYKLGSLNELELSFTDATITPKGVLFSAAAEASPDATSDGVVNGSVLGILDSNPPRWIEICTPDGAWFTGKVEGICASRESEQHLFVVIDADDPELPCELCEIELSGEW
ncbi:hypothetical protein [Pseudanabaena sp. FACHB-2040]|uniref:DUF6929 family protein n=1 Tax=Pseudanabaena sp. FACHB-2040 TaxID=2692859 RepID=UPI0016878741|nr:hypothetical protein [Pseudanabaena sp. FACHB-2040]MBD2259349.1 hypothetical protein [Pseudanabaena sp. FACHB-2040]